MTKNEAIWDVIIARLSNPATATDGLIRDAIAVAEKVEAAGFAPWMDVPTQRIDAPPAANRITFDLPTTPERREITEADVVPGAVFRDEDGDEWEVKAVKGGKARIDDDDDWRSVEHFIKQRKEYNATVTLP